MPSSSSVETSKRGEDVEFIKFAKSHGVSLGGPKKQKGPDGEKKKPVTVTRTGGVQNKQAATMQITSEQILKDAFDRQEEFIKPPKQVIHDIEELQEYRIRKRKEFEDNIRKNRYHIGHWIKYAQWEESQKEFDRARSVYERALDVDYRNVNLWLRYTAMEMRNKFVNHARNLWNRAVFLLPRVDQLWYKYAHMEEILGSVEGAREVFERWMEFHPDERAWKAYIKLEMRYNNLENARNVLERYVRVHPSINSWIYYAYFEQKQGDIERARKVFERCLSIMGEKAHNEEFFISFAKFEESQKEIERARVIYKFALDHISKHRAPDLYKKFITFEKQYGDREGIEDVIIGKKRFQYEEELKQNSHNYDVWFDYIRLEEAAGDIDKIREVYERAIANIPPLQEKRFWRRYIYLWINYALFEELTAKDVPRTREVYANCLKVIPHKLFSFSKMWILFAKFEIRNKNLEISRSILGHAIGIAPKDKIFKEYIHIELSLGNIDRVRKIFEKYLEFNVANCTAWKMFAELEKKLEDIERARSIYELAIKQPVLDAPEMIWKAYIDFEISLKECDNTRKLYERLLGRTKHAKVWISYALFEASIGQIDTCREIFQRAEKYFKTGSLEVEEETEETEQQRKEQRVMLLEKWKEFEFSHGNEDTRKQITSKMPRKVKKRRKVKVDGVETGGFVEYYDYIFPEEGAIAPNLMLLERAYQWKTNQQKKQ